MQMKRRVQSPVDRIRCSAGLAPRPSVSAPYSNQAKGSRHSRNTAGLAAGRSSSLFTAASIELLQVHAGVERGDLRLVAVEQPGLGALGEEAAAVADAALGRLAPARMIAVRVDVGIEAVFLRRRLVPGGRRLLVEEADSDDRLRALEAVLPWHHDPHRRAVLVRKHFA